MENLNNGGGAAGAAGAGEDFVGYMENIAAIEAEERADEEMFRAHEVRKSIYVLYSPLYTDRHDIMITFEHVVLTPIFFTHSLSLFPYRNGNKQRLLVLL